MVRDSDIDSLSSDSLQADPSEPKATAADSTSAASEPRTAAGRRILTDIRHVIGSINDLDLAEWRSIILAIEAEAAQPAAPSVAPEPIGPVRITSANCRAGDHDDCLGMVEQDVAELGITDCLCHCHAPGEPPALAGHEHDWETCKQCAEVFDAGRG
jgi:hypothetical protein